MVASRTPPQIDIWQSREWTDYVKCCVNGFRMRSSSTSLGHHDWDDIAQTAIIHIWKKRAQYNPALPLKPWLKVITLHQIQNQLRKRFAGRSKMQMDAKLRWHFSNPRPFLTRTVNADSLQEEVRMEPDMIDPRTVLTEQITMEDLGEVKPLEREALRELLFDANPSRVVKRKLKKGRLKRGQRQLQNLYRRRIVLRALYTKALNAKSPR